MFTSDNLVVYPAQGVGKIERIDRKEIGGVTCDFYIVRIRANNIKLMVPVQNASSVGLRALITAAEANRILELLYADYEKEIATGSNWNRRFRNYSSKLKSPDLAEVANVLKELLIIGRGKDLSFGERRLLEQAMDLVSGELAEVLSRPAESLREELMARYAPVQLEEEAAK